ncbi:ATP-binding cassette domain-containing protein [Desulfosporosinus sp. BG]|uniref:ABC transporter ATP-binding protein n=1 Tax=Desulfosporosinus sp. BG TaxID=1633135 RepID=UPI00083B4BC0|nr:ATP-binding cassette domain-containing protein [Desulfosporosinus sp. BG]
MLKIINASKAFLAGTPNEHVALKNVSLSLTKGEFVTIIGSNGAGKSTLFNAIGGTFWLDRGKILLQGDNITYMAEHRRASMIGRLFQDPVKGTAPDMTIEENLALAYNRKSKNGLRIGVHRKDVQIFREKIAQLNMGLENRMKTKVGLLSGGQRQALSLLMATISTPRLLLLDEHTAALDPASAEKIMLITKNIVSQESITTMMITHNIQSALKTGSRTIMLDRGKIILDISGQERADMTVPRLMELFSQQSKNTLDNDRMLFVNN